MKEQTRKSFATENSKRLGKKVYNPNTFNAVDSALIFIIVLVAFVVVSFLFQKFLLPSADVLEKYYYEYNCLSVLLSQGSMVIIAIVYSKIRNVSFLNGGGFKYKKDSVNALFGVLLVAGIALLFSAVHYQFVDDVSIFSTNSSFTDNTINIDEDSINVSAVFLFAFVLVPVLPAICEECVFRGIIMRGLNEKGAVFAVIMSSACFSLMHGSFEQIILQFFGGLAIGGVVMITKNFYIGSIMHFSYNLFVMIVQAMILVVEEYTKRVAALIDAITIICGIIFLIVGVLYFGNMIMSKVKNTAKGKKQTCKAEKPLYAILSDNEGNAYRRVEYYELEENTLNYSKTDTTYFSNSKVKFFNKQSKNWLFYLLMSASIILSIVIIILEL